MQVGKSLWLLWDSLWLIWCCCVLARLHVAVVCSETTARPSNTKHKYSQIQIQTVSDLIIICRNNTHPSYVCVSENLHISPSFSLFMFLPVSNQLSVCLIFFLVSLFSSPWTTSKHLHTVSLWLCLKQVAWLIYSLHQYHWLTVHKWTAHVHCNWISFC